MTRLPHPRFLAFLAVLAGAAAVFWRPFGPERAFTLGFDLAAAVFAALAYPLWRETGPAGLRLRAARDDGGRVLLPAVALLALAAVLVSLGRMLAAPGRAPGEDLALVLGTLFLAWAFGNLVAAFHYAHLFYARRGAAGPRGRGWTFPAAAHQSSAISAISPSSSA